MPSADTPPSIELLLADAQTRLPTLADGLPATAIQAIPRPTRQTGASVAFMLDAQGENPNDLERQRWGVIAPVGPEGDALLAAIADLIALREQEQGAKAIVFRVNPSMTPDESTAWKENVYYSESITEDERPRFLLILGDLDQVSIELQHTLGVSSFVGRLHFDDASGYRAYAAKVRRYAEQPSAPAAPDALFYAARDPSMTTIAGFKQLVKPCAEAAASWKRSGKLAAENIVEVTKWGVKLDDFLGPASGVERPAVLLSSSHGIGLKRHEPAEKRRAMQGALTLGTAGLLSAETVARSRFLPGGMWLCVACFGAGTPTAIASAYAPWLSLLAKEGAAGASIDAVLESLPGDGERPFVAALPQAALANPEGPLGVIGHMDLAWSYSFLSTETFKESRASRIFSALRVLIDGGRAGVSLNALMRFYTEANNDLMAGYQAQENARVFGQADPTDVWRRGNLWMLRQDLRGYVLLGDPAARIGIQRTVTKSKTASPLSTDNVIRLIPDPKPSEPAASSAPASAPASTPASAPASTPAAAPASTPSTAPVSTPAMAPDSATAAQKEAAVLALMRGDEAPRAIAARCGASLESLWSWFETYRAGGRRALDPPVHAPSPRKIRSRRPD